MAGTLGRLAEMAPEDIERIHAGLTTSANDAIKQLMARGIDTPGPPESYRGEMPPNLTSMSDNEIGDLLNKLSSWCGFLEGVGRPSLLHQGPHPYRVQGG
jgi:hypothetical protein